MGIEFTPDQLAKLGMPPQPKTERQNKEQSEEKPQKPKEATAPYNFIDLPEEVLQAPLDKWRNEILSGEEEQLRNALGRYLKEEGKLGGHIEMSITTLAPVFIGEKNKTFTMGGVPIIPGSTIRGMVKNLVKIATHGAMRPGEDFYDRHLYYRCIMAPNTAPQWQKDLHEMYAGQMTDGGKWKTQSGFLIKTKDGWFVCPLKEGRQAERMLIRQYERESGDTIEPGIKDVRVAWKGRDAYAISGKSKGNLYESKEAYSAFLDQIALETNPKRAEEMKKKIGKQFVLKYSLGDADWEQRIPVFDDVVKEYENDKSRRGVELLRLFSKDEPKGGAIAGKRLRQVCPEAPSDIEQISPCCYLPDGKSGDVCAFGHGHFFRVIYPFSIGDAVPEAMKTLAIDFADAIFGAMRDGKPLWASRVFFEDGRLDGQSKWEKKAHALPLMEPNPTSFQLYLCQTDKEHLVNWGNQNARIRGYKLYWHQQGAKWEAPPKMEKEDMKKPLEKQMTREITPLSAGNTFTARLRFQRLSKEELGALLSVFRLSGGKSLSCKLGRGKAIGLGSVDIQATLFLTQTEGYAKLFGNDGWNTAEKETDATEYIEAFRRYAQGKGCEGKLRHTANQLAKMLDWENATRNPEEWRNKVASMSGDVQSGNVDRRYMERAILPNVSNVYPKQSKGNGKKKKGGKT